MARKGHLLARTNCNSGRGYLLQISMHLEFESLLRWDEGHTYGFTKDRRTRGCV